MGLFNKLFGKKELNKKNQVAWFQSGKCRKDV